MSQKQARALRKASEPKGLQPIKLDASRAAGSRILNYVNGTVQQVLVSRDIQNIVAAYLDAKELDGNWGVRLTGFHVGEVWLVPQPQEPQPAPTPDDGPSAGRANGSTSKPAVDKAKAVGQSA